MTKVLYVSKPVEPPFRDGSKNLVRALSTHLSRYDAQVLVTRGKGAPVARGGRAVEAVDVLPPKGMGYAPRLYDHVPVFVHLLREREAAIHHHFFAPNPRSSFAARLVTRLRRVPTVHTLASAPKEDLDVCGVLFADVNVVLSRHTETRLLEAGVPGERVRRIPAFIEPPTPSGVSPAETRRALGLPLSGALVCFPGDLEVGGGAQLLLRALAALRREEVIVAIAHRPKTPLSKRFETDLRAMSAALGVTPRVHFVGETPRIHALLEASDVVAFPSTSLYGKTDQPLVLLEAMALGRPVIVAEGSPAEELAEEGAALAVTPAPEALAHAIRQLASDEGRRRALGERGAAAVASRHSVEGGVRAYEGLYDELLGSSSGG